MVLLDTRSKHLIKTRNNKKTEMVQTEKIERTTDLKYHLPNEISPKRNYLVINEETGRYPN